MRYLTLTPSLPLADAVETFRAYEGYQPPHAFERVFPSGTVENRSCHALTAKSPKNIRPDMDRPGVLEFQRRRRRPMSPAAKATQASEDGSGTTCT